ncbi:MAG: hypothetical protein RRA92_07210 [Gemmatimonadota bacterium]|nr:hypothetical protein [Gemmatimonadota bacterium]
MSGRARTDAWLAQRLAGAPPALAGEVGALVREAAARPVPRLGGGEVADLLAAAGLAALREVAGGSGSRAAALRLLAADAALTCAFEAAAELGGDVAALCAAVGPAGALGGALAESSGAAGRAAADGGKDGAA